MANNSKERHQVILYPTAIRSDLLFYEFVDRRLPGNAPETCNGTYGEPHWNPREFPNHKLVFRSPGGEPNVEKWYYAASREQQDDYNWDIGQGTELVRSYLVLREKYYGRSIAEAAAVTPPLYEEFTYPVIATADARFSKYGFADDTVLDAPEELKSLYIVVKRRFLRPVVFEISYEDNLELRIKTTYTIVPTDHTLPADSVGVVYSLEPVNSYHSRQVKREVVPESNGWILTNFVRTQATRSNIQNMPRELVSVHVLWNAQYSVGTQDYFFIENQTGNSFTLAHSANDSASSSAAVTAELQLKFRDIESSNLPTTEYELMLAGNVTEAAVLARMNAILSPATITSWPVFRPESVTVSTTGQSINVRTSVGVSLSGTISDLVLTASGMTRSTSDDFGVNLNVGSVQIPACIHGAITITGGTSQAQSVAATATMTMYNTLVGMNTATKTKSGTAYGLVSPSTIPAISGYHKTIPTSGLYALDIRPGRNFLGCTSVLVTVLNAANLNPSAP